MPRYINPFCDVGFKRIFGQEYSKPLLISFLNNLLKGEKEITDLTFLDKEQPGICEDDRSLIYDIYCTTVDGEKIIVEMQLHSPTSRSAASTTSPKPYHGRGSREPNGNTT